MNSAEEIKKFKELLDQGLITKEEFERKKNKLLGVNEVDMASMGKSDKKKTFNSNKKMLTRFVIIVVAFVVVIFGAVKITGVVKQHESDKAKYEKIENIMTQYGLDDYKVTNGRIICEDFESLSGSDMYDCIRSLISEDAGDTVYVNGSDYYYYVSSLWAADSRNNYSVGGIYRSDGGSNRRCVYEE